MSSICRKELEKFVKKTIISYSTKDEGFSRDILNVTDTLDSLGLDSLDVTGIIIDVEAEYSVSIPDSLIERPDIRFGEITVSGIIEEIEKHIKTAP